MRQRGFTLLEAMIALAVSALVLSALYGAIVRAAAAREGATRSVARTAASRTLVLHVAHELESALVSDEPAAPERFVVTAPTDGAPPWSTLRFARVGRDGLVELLAYRVEPAAGAGALVRAHTSRFAPPDAPEPPGVTVLEDVRLFRVRCFDGGAWRGACTGPLLPRAIEVTVGVDDDAGGIAESSTTVTLPVRRRS
jgi:prepilin-type N-terminal cleavage/methylation domain-containing protein